MKKFMAVFVLLLASALVFSTAIFPVRAETLGDFTVIGGTGYTYEDGVLTITGSDPVTISGTTTSDRIVVNSGSGANITLSNVNIDTYSTGASAFEITESTTGTVTVTLEGSNSLTSGGNSAGLQKNGESCELLINGAGGLTATSGTGGAGIGGAQGKSSGKIEIYTSSTKIKLVTGGTGGAGIGGGKNGNGSNITITHGVIEVGDHDGAYGNGNASNGSMNGAGIGGGEGGSGRYITIADGVFGIFTGGGGAGIGGGKGGEGSNIKITGGNISCALSNTGAGIGGGEDADGYKIEIIGGTIVNTKSLDGGACIGGGKFGDGREITISGSAGVTINQSVGKGACIGGGEGGDGTDIKIFDKAEVTARGEYGAGIGGGEGGDGTNIKIYGSAKVTANGNQGAGIGGGKFGDGKIITISGDAKVTANGAHQNAAIGGGAGGNGDQITIEGNASVTAYGGLDGAGIGGGARIEIETNKYRGGDGSNITINTTGKVTTTGQDQGAGIGGGSCGIGSNITIKKGTVVATGGDTAVGFGGAGIGGGRNSCGKNITIEGGDVTAISKHGGAGIGGGADYDNITLCGRESDPTGKGITISGGKVTVIVENPNNIAAMGYNGGAGIGGGKGGNGGADGEGNGITISGGEVDITIKGNGAGIGGGGTGMTKNTAASGGNGTNITISGGTVNIKVENSGTNGAGIGGGGAEKANGGDGKGITITGGDVTVNCNGPGAGIGGGFGGSGKDITISGGKVNVNSTAGAGIGGGIKTFQGGTGENITISGTAEVIAISGSGAGIGGSSGGDAKNIKITGGTVFALGNGIGIGGQNSDATVYIKGVSGTKYPWVFTNKITSSNYDGRYGTGNDGYLGIVFEYASGNSFTDKENNNFIEGIVYGTSKTVEIMDDYTLKTGKKLTVPANVTFATKDMFTLDSSILYLNAGAKLDKWYKMEIKGTGEIQHEDSSIYKWYGAEKYEFINETNYTELYSLNGSEGIVLCDICGEPEPHDATTGDWVTDPKYHWKLGTCALGDDCAFDTHRSAVTLCSYIVDGTKLYYGVHRYNNTPDRVDGNTRYYYCIDCNYEKKVTGSNTPKPTGSNPTSRTGIIMLYKVDLADGSPLEGAKFGLYSDEECTSLIKSAVSEMDGGNAVVSFKVSAGDTYYVKEISAPSGYRLSGKVFRAKVSSDGTVTYSVVGSSGSSEDIPVCENVKGTGNPGTAAGLGVAGIAVMSGIVCIVSLVKKGRKRQL